MFNQLGEGLRCGAAVFGQHREGNGWVPVGTHHVQGWDKRSFSD